MTTSYVRVIPRDLFNEANLLKCYGQLYLELERLHLPHVDLAYHSPASCFQVDQNQDDGSLSILNVILHKSDQAIRLHRPLNSRESWPLYATVDEEEIEVFDSHGRLSQEFVNYLTKGY